ncbi:MAG: LiaI-LiaF-like domain-containing protein [Chloroflexota bacterium]
MKKRAPGIVPGVLLILLGLFFLMQQLAPRLLSWSNIWPLFPTLAGLAFLAGWLFGRERDPGLLFIGTAATLVGLFFFPFSFGLLNWAEMARLWPAFPIIGGLAFLAQFAASRFRDWGAAGVGCLATLVGLIAFGFTLFRLPRPLGDLLLKLWPLGLIFLGLLGLASAFLRRRD